MLKCRICNDRLVRREIKDKRRKSGRRWETPSELERRQCCGKPECVKMGHRSAYGQTRFIAYDPGKGGAAKQKRRDAFANWIKNRK